MRSVSWATSFKRAYKKFSQKHPGLREKFELTLRQLVDDPFSSSLDTHKLKGTLVGLWACSVAYDCRIVFEIIKEGDDEVFLLIDIGTHDEVY